MDTWEIVLILLLLTVSVLVISKHEIPLSFVTLLDNIYFQLIILGLTLALSTVSPASALVAVATVVIMYYVRNVVKIQIFQMTQQAQEEQLNNEVEQPRIEITEEKRTNNISADDEALELALNPHVNKQTNSRLSTAGRLDPGVVEKFTNHSDFDSTQLMDNESHVMIPEVDSNIFSKGGNAMPYNEDLIYPASRSFNGLAGQYDISEMRPKTNPEKYEELDFMPMSGMGSNNFETHGYNIDDKLTILKKGMKPSSLPPPNYSINA
jgi:hypothetical protein